MVQIDKNLHKDDNLDFDKNLNLEDFNIQREIENLLYNSQETIFQYDTLVYRLQSVIESLDSPVSSPLSLAFNDIIDAYYLKIENKKRAINLLDYKVTRFNKIYDMEKKLNKHYYAEREIAKEYRDFIKEYNSKQKE